MCVRKAVPMLRSIFDLRSGNLVEDVEDFPVYKLFSVMQITVHMKVAI